VDEVVARVNRDFAGSVLAAADAGRSSEEVVAVRLEADRLAADGDAVRAAWAVAQWSVAVAEPLRLVAVDVGDSRWERADDEAGWQAGVLDDPLPDGAVVVLLAPAP
jgi:hypothetical protein